MAAAIHTGGPALFVAVFVACAVEMVEALTIVVAVGVSRGWRSAFVGSVGAIVVLALGVLTVGPAVIHWVPIDALRVVIGILLLIVGFNWLRKAVLRASGRKAKHDEDAIFADTVDQLRAEPAPAGTDWPACAVAFKGVFLEGLEVVIIVVTLGAASHDLGLASMAAGAALAVVGVVGAIVARQLSNVPENAMKMVVGLMLVSFGTFWLGEGLGLRWPGTDLALLFLLAAYALIAWVAVVTLKRSHHDVVT